MRNWIINTLLIAAFALAVAISGDKPKPQPTSYEEPTTTEILTTTEEPSTKPEIMTTTQQTTTAVPITTTVHPTLPPTPNITTWSVTQGNSTCILLEAGIRMTFNYVNYTDDETPDTNITNFKIDVPADAKASGTCEEVEQTITLKFFETFHSDGWFLTLVFKKGDTAKKYYMSDIMFNYEISPDQFPGAKREREAYYYANETVKPFNVDENKHYSCVHQNLLAYNKSAISNGVIEVSAYNLNVEAFRTKSGGGFSSGTVRCSADEVSQLVPIVVGAVLAGLIVIVLIAYLIGRRRSRRGYESV